MIVETDKEERKPLDGVFFACEGRHVHKDRARGTVEQEDVRGDVAVVEFVAQDDNVAHAKVLALLCRKETVRTDDVKVARVDEKVCKLTSFVLDAEHEELKEFVAEERRCRRELSRWAPRCEELEEGHEEKVDARNVPENEPQEALRPDRKTRGESRRDDLV